MIANSINSTSHTRRYRRSQSEIQEIRDVIRDLLDAENPMTNRQVFYRLVSLGAIAKTEGEYKSTVCRLLKEMRLDGSIQFEWVADNTRWMRKPKTHSSMEDALLATAQTYRRALWDDLGVYVEVWLEKEVVYQLSVGLAVTFLHSLSKITFECMTRKFHIGVIAHCPEAA